MKSLMVALAILLLAPMITAEDRVLKVTIADTGVNNLPELVEQIKRALRSTDLNVTFTVLPDERAIVLVKSGDLALDLYRQPTAYGSAENIVQLEPAINSLVLNMFVAADRKELCDVDIDEFSTLSVTGVRGIKLFASDIYPLFKSNVVAPGGKNIVQLVASQRVDVSFWPESVLGSQFGEFMDQIHICEQRAFEFSFYSYLHEDYLWAKEPIEKAYREAFSSPSN